LLLAALQGRRDQSGEPMLAWQRAMKEFG